MSDVGAASRPRATVLGASLEGWNRVRRAPAALAGVWAVTAIASLPLSLTSLRHTAETGTAWDPATAGLIVATATGALFLSGGLINRFARGRPVGSQAFFGASGAHFLRFLRLVALLGPLYWLLCAGLSWASDMAAARIAALCLLTMVADFARVRTVVEDRRSMLAGLSASVRFIRRRPLRTVTLWLLHAAAAGVLIWVAIRIGPSVDVAPWVKALFWAATSVLAVTMRLAFLASEAVFFQGELAHAGYTAAPLPVWPDSPAVEAIGRLKAYARSAQDR